MKRRVAVRILLLQLAFGLLRVQAQAQGLPSADTLRHMLLRSGFAEALDAAGVHDLDRALTSSELATSPTTFVAAYYFVDELEQTQELGPLHVSRFDRRDRRWTDAPDLGDDIGGSVLRVQISARYVLLHLHWNPSAGQSVVLDARTLKLMGSVPGLELQELRDGSIVYAGNTIHFAPTHQERLFVFNPRSRRSTELFPGTRESVIASDYRRAIQTVYAGLPPARKDVYERSVYGAVDDFDRTIGTVVRGADGRRIAFVAGYGCDRLGDDIPHPVLTTVVQCRRRAIESWSCDEYELEEGGRAVGVPLTRTPDGHYQKEQIERLLHAMVRQP